MASTPPRLNLRSNIGTSSRHWVPGFAVCVAALLLCLGIAAQESKPSARSQSAARAQSATITGVEGPSWIQHLGRALSNTSMGKTGRWGPAPDDSGARSQAEPVRTGFLAQKMSVSGADLYRFNCQACHQATGAGDPPEINSILPPVQATSPNLIMQKMKERGFPVSSANAGQQAAQARIALLQRLHNGGVSMPPFPDLSEAEVTLLVGYLNQLAAIPGSQNKRTIEEPTVRVGEHVVKATCSICHAATGADPSSEQLLRGAIPPLSVLAMRTNASEFLRKVRTGAPIVMGNPAIAYRGRMPIFYYLRDDEIAAAYMYLNLYPPHTGDTTVAAAGAAPEKSRARARAPGHPKEVLSARP